MSRSGYTDDYEHVQLWRQAVANAIRGRRGQAFLREMLNALDALPEKRLIADELATDDGVCAIGAVIKARGLSANDLDPYDHHQIAETLNIVPILAQEVYFINDEWPHYYSRGPVTPEIRYIVVRNWIKKQLGEIEDGRNA